MERFVEVSILATVAWPIARFCSNGPVWRLFPRPALTACGLVGVYLVLVAAAAIAAPFLLRVFAVVAVAVLAYERWRARTHDEASRGLPPGSLAPLPPGEWADRFHFRDLAARHGRTLKISHLFHPMICIVGLEQGLDLIRRHDKTLASPAMPFSRFIPGEFLRYQRVAIHQKYKNLLHGRLSRDVVEHHRRTMADRIADEFARLADDCALTGAGGVSPRPYIQRMVLSAWAPMFFGVPPDSERFARLAELYRVIDIRNPSGASDAAVRAALDELTAIVKDEQQQRLPSFLAEAIRADPLATSDPTLLGNLVFLMHTSWSDVTALLVWLLKVLTDEPQWAARLRQKSAGGTRPAGASNLAGRVVLETLRLNQSEHLYRIARETISENGVVLPKGWLVRVCVWESHRDPRVFDRPETFDPDRFLARAYSKTEFCPFGAFRLACLGEYLTKTVGEIFVSELARGFEWSATSDGPPEMSTWRHWMPSSRFEVAMTRRVDIASDRHAWAGAGL